MPIAAIGLGANLPSPVGEPKATIAAAIERLAEYGRVTARSSMYRTTPVGYLEQPDFVNAVALLDTTLAPAALLDALLAVERSFGRDRSLRPLGGPPKGPRTLDLDLLLYETAGDETAGDGIVLNEPALTLPHPAMHERRFVLAPLAEIAPRWRHPLLGKTMTELLVALPAGDSSVVRVDAR